MEDGAKVTVVMPRCVLGGQLGMDPAWGIVSTGTIPLVLSTSKIPVQKDFVRQYPEGMHLPRSKPTHLTAAHRAPLPLLISLILPPTPHTGSLWSLTTLRPLPAQGPVPALPIEVTVLIPHLPALPPAQRVLL